MNEGVRHQRQPDEDAHLLETLLSTFGERARLSRSPVAMKRLARLLAIVPIGWLATGRCASGM
jgi:hypothetical protein